MNENQLQVADGKELDRETVPVHNLIILATDEGQLKAKQQSNSGGTV